MDLASVSDKIEKEIAGYQKLLGKNARVGMGFLDFHSFSAFGINHNKPEWAASMIKVPVMIAAMGLADSKYLSLEEKIKLDHSVALWKGSVASMKEDTYLTINQLLHYMIIESDNEATNLMIRRIGISRINNFIKRMQCHSTSLCHMLCKGAKIEEKGVMGDGSNTTSPEDMAIMLANIYGGCNFYSQTPDYMKSLLEYRGKEYRNVNSIFRSRLPLKAIVGAKGGNLENHLHEAAMINRDYILCVMASDVVQKNKWAAEMLMKFISGTVYSAYYKC